MHEAALQADEDPDRLSVSARCVWSNVEWPALPPFPIGTEKHFMKPSSRRSSQERVSSSRNRLNPRGVKRRMSNYPRVPANRSALAASMFPKTHKNRQMRGI